MSSGDVLVSRPLRGTTTVVTTGKVVDDDDDGIDSDNRQWN